MYVLVISTSYLGHKDFTFKRYGHFKQYEVILLPWIKIQTLYIILTSKQTLKYFPCNKSSINNNENYMPDSVIYYYGRSQSL